MRALAHRRVERELVGDPDGGRRKEEGGKVQHRCGWGEGSRTDGRSMRAASST